MSVSLTELLPTTVLGPVPMGTTTGHGNPGTASTKEVGVTLGLQDRRAVSLRDRSPIASSRPSCFVRWQQHGDTRAREELVQRFLPLARKLAQSLQRCSRTTG